MRPKGRVDSRHNKKEPEVMHRLYEFRCTRHLIQNARKYANLGKHITMDASRHRGMTELGDAEATEQELMSALVPPLPARVYVKRSEKQRMATVRKRRKWVVGKNWVTLGTVLPQVRQSGVEGWAPRMPVPRAPTIQG
jgi:hypothetical protein